MCLLTINIRFSRLVPPCSCLLRRGRRAKLRGQNFPLGNGRQAFLFNVEFDQCRVAMAVLGEQGRVKQMDGNGCIRAPRTFHQPPLRFERPVAIDTAGRYGARRFRRVELLTVNWNCDIDRDVITGLAGKTSAYPG